MTRKIRSLSRLPLVLGIGAALLSATAIARPSDTAAEEQASNTAANGQTTEQTAKDQKSNQTAQTSNLTGIVVTAARLSTPLEKTPIAVTALSPEILADRQIVNVQDLMNQIPGVQITQATSSVSQMGVTFRGARTETGGIRANGTVGIYIDNVIQPRPNASFFNLFDVDQVEVLRGPQGTLYGRNTSGGAIKIETKLPAYYWTGSAQLGVGNYGGREGKVYVSGPLIDNQLAFSFAAVHTTNDGFVYNIPLGRRINNTDLNAERFKVLYQPTDKVTFNFAVYALQDHSGLVIPTPLANLPGVVDPYAVPGRNLFTNEMYVNTGQSNIQKGASLNADWNVTDSLKLDSITGYGHMSAFNQGNNTFLTAAAQQAMGGKLSLATNTQGYLTDKWVTQEFNALYTGDRFSGIAGLYYYYEQGQTSSVTNGAVTDIEESETAAPAVFAQGTYTLGGGVSAVAGLRYTYEIDHYLSHSLIPPVAPQLGRAIFPSTTPKLGLNWQINPNLFTYMSWTQGTRSGGFNSRTLSGVLQPSPYAAEWVDSYELGSKFITSDNKFSLNTTVYEADYSNQQLVTIIAGPGYVALFYNNAGGSRVRGLEIESDWQVLDSFRVYAVAAFQEGNYTKHLPCFDHHGVRMDCIDKHLKGLPAQKWSLGFKYTPTIPMIPGKVSINGSWDHTSTIYNYTSGPLPPPAIDYGPQRKLDLLNTSLNWFDGQGHWNAALEVHNLTNRHYWSAGYASSSPTSVGWVGYMAAPRTVWFRIGYAF
ncbi:MAG: TonB-dependent receptor [Rhodanobacter sp.]